MAGLYLHIPFCRRACYYCDFHFSVNTTYADRMVAALIGEAELLAHQTPAEWLPLETLYFGGGTPSLLSEAQLGRLMEALARLFPWQPNAELTLEANPEDLSPAKARRIRQWGFNRLSLGIQALQDEQLRQLNRAHTRRDAFRAVEIARAAGFDNLSADLIYALPGMGLASWQQTLRDFETMQIPHLSAYCLTIEENTVFGRRAAKNQLATPEEESQAQQFEYLMDWADAQGYTPYEISNFGKEGYFSQHNRAYWAQVPFWGLGPGAFSFDGQHRWANPRNNHRYMQALEAGKLFREQIALSPAERLNEYLLTALRTAEGCPLSALLQPATEAAARRLRAEISWLQGQGWLQKRSDRLVLTRQGKLLADGLAARLFLEEADLRTK